MIHLQEILSVKRFVVLWVVSVL